MILICDLFVKLVSVTALRVMVKSHFNTYMFVKRKNSDFAQMWEYFLLLFNPNNTCKIPQGRVDTAHWPHGNRLGLLLTSRGTSGDSVERGQTTPIGF